jgi:hypothetical protein
MGRILCKIFGHKFKGKRYCLRCGAHNDKEYYRLGIRSDDEFDRPDLEFGEAMDFHYDCGDR